MKEPTYEQMMKYILLLKSMEAAGMELNEQQKNILRMCKEKGLLPIKEPDASPTSGV